jgi:hypothetical protein
MKLWEILEQYKILKNLINAIKYIYVNSKVCVPNDHEIESCIILNANKALRQGCWLSEILHIYIYIKI